MDPVTGTLLGSGISALANIGGGFMSAGSAAANNAQQLALQQQQQDFQNNVNNATWEHDQAMAQYNWGNQQLQNQFNWNAMEWSAANNAQQAATQMAFQRDMSSTAYQRTVADMLKAGINPILAYQQGGASTPMGAMGSSSPASGGMPSGSSHPGSGTSLGFNPQNTGAEVARGISNAVSSATDAAKTYAGVDLMHEQAKTQENQRTNLDQDSQKKGQETERTIQETYTEKERNKLLREQQDATRAAAQASRASSAKSYADASVSSGMAKNLDRYGSTQMPNTLERIFRGIDNYGPGGMPIPGSAGAPGQ